MCNHENWIWSFSDGQDSTCKKVECQCDSCPALVRQFFDVRTNASLKAAHAAQYCVIKALDIYGVQLPAAPEYTQ